MDSRSCKEGSLGRRGKKFVGRIVKVNYELSYAITEDGRCYNLLDLTEVHPYLVEYDFEVGDIVFYSSGGILSNPCEVKSIFLNVVRTQRGIFSKNSLFRIVFFPFAIPETMINDIASGILAQGDYITRNDYARFFS